MNKLLGVALGAMMLVPEIASARVIVGVGPVYRPYGFYHYGYAPYWAGGPFWWDYPAPSRPPTGAIKFDTPEKNADVYVNGAFAGKVGEVKTLHLAPGSYAIRISEPGRESFDEDVYVTRGSTVKLHPGLHPEPSATNYGS